MALVAVAVGTTFDSMETPAVPTVQRQAFQFVNISNPQQARDKKRKDIVRRHVRPVSSKNVRVTETIMSATKESDSAEVVDDGFAFVNTTHPDQVKSAKMRTFVKQNSQRRNLSKPGSKLLFVEEEVPPIVSSWSRELPKVRTQPKRIQSDLKVSNQQILSWPPNSTLDEMDVDVTPVEVVTIPEEAADDVEVLSSWSRNLPKRRKERSKQVKDARKEMRAQQSRFRVTINKPGTAWENVAQLFDRQVWPMSHLSGTTFPIRMNTELYQIVTYLHCDHKVTQVPPSFMASWFCIIVQDESAFQSLLSLATRQQSMVHGVVETDMGLRLHTNALISVQERLGDPDAHKSLGLFTGVLMFLCLDILSLDRERFEINLSGAKRIINLRGGIESLDDHLTHRIFLLVGELCGIYAFDLPPAYYVDGAISKTKVREAYFPMSNLLASQLISLRYRLSNSANLCGILHDMFALSTHIRRDGAKAFAINVALDPAIYVLPMKLFQILKELELSTDPDSGMAMVSVVAHAGVCCMNAFRVAIADCPTTFHRNHILRFKAAVETTRGSWSGLEDMYLWCLVQGGINAWDEDRVAFVEFMREHMVTQGLMGWNDVMNILENMFYVEVMFKRDYEAFGAEVMAFVE